MSLRNPRQVWATSCDDARFVATAPVVHLGGEHPAAGPEGLPAPSPTAHPFVAAGGSLRLVGAVQDGTVRAVLHGHPGVIDVGTHAAGEVAAVATDRAVIVAWTGAPQGLALAFVSRDGTVHPFPSARPDGAVIADGRSPSLAVGAGLLTVFYEAPVPWGVALFAAQFDAVTGVRARAPVPVDGPAVSSPAVAWANGRFALAWAVGTRVRFSTLVPRAMRVEPAVDLVTVGAPVGRVAVAAGGGRVAVAWSDARSGTNVLYSTAVDPVTRRGTGAEQRLSMRFDPAARPSLAWDGGAFGVAWWEPVGGGSPRAYLALIDREGNRIGTQMRVLMADETGVDDAALAWTGRGYLLAYGRVDGVVEARQTGPRGCDEEP